MQNSPEQIFKDYLRANTLRHTSQRQTVLEVMLQAEEHLSIEQIYDQAKKEDSSLGQATVYRTIRHLCSAGLVREVRFDDGLARYEVEKDEHHDHLICTGCGKTLSVQDLEIERLQDNLAKVHGFKPVSHCLYLYGICGDCQGKD